ncbi:MAG: hypothetical protein L6R40_000312 [Gallowayella cf. fulva]|nr:MAG: hypothetical protein L6R40_000312 [Xanthomendoza cf. fulva]
MATKRKAIDDFFLPSKDCGKSLTQVCHPVDSLNDSRIPKNTPVPGLSVYDDFIDAMEEKKILSFLNDPTLCDWRTDLSRRTMHFGGTYCLMPQRTAGPAPPKPAVLQAPPMPQELCWLIQRMVDSDVYQEGHRPQYCIVNEYTGSLGISAHTENFEFGEPVVGLSLLSSCPIRFHELVEPFDGSVRSGKAAQAQKTGRVVDIQLPPRSLLVMKGPSRWSWQHEIVRSAKGRGPGWKRVSLTFRFKP